MSHLPQWLTARWSLVAVRAKRLQSVGKWADNYQVARTLWCQVLRCARRASPGNRPGCADQPERQHYEHEARHRLRSHSWGTSHPLEIFVVLVLALFLLRFLPAVRTRGRRVLEVVRVLAVTWLLPRFGLGDLVWARP